MGPAPGEIAVEMAAGCGMGAASDVFAAREGRGCTPSCGQRVFSP
jgi:hypothetical protein